MKKPWVAGILSAFVPGLGLIVIGQVSAGLGILAAMAVLVLLSLTRTSSILATWSFVLALLVWMVQLGYTLLASAARPAESPGRIARREARRKQLEAAVIQREARGALEPLLLPSEHLRMALDGMGDIDVQIVGGFLLGLVHSWGGGAAMEGPERPTTILGITDNELVFSTTRKLPKPSDLHRVPLCEVSLVEFNEGRLGYDRLVLHTGRRKLRVHTLQSMRSVVRELTGILSK